MREALSETLAAAIRKADEKARNRNQEFVGTEHLLLGILFGDDKADAVRALKTTQRFKEVRLFAERDIPVGKEPPLITGPLPLSPRAQHVMNIAVAAAHAAGEPSVSTRFVLLGLIQEPESATMQFLRDAGADLEHLNRLLNEKPPKPEK